MKNHTKLDNKVIGHLTIGTNDLNRMTKLYDAPLATLGIQKLWQHGDRHAASVGNGVMVAFKVDSAEQVDAFYAMGIELKQIECLRHCTSQPFYEGVRIE